MFGRNLTTLLSDWKTKHNRKPLVIRGARQVGKTSIVNMFGRQSFETYLYINLELSDNAALFTRMNPIRELVQLIELKFNRKITPGSTLVFIDEVQNSDIAMNQLRYFHEELPDLHIIAAGSLLEVKMRTEGFTFPVGRVEYCYMHPLTFEEFLAALQDAEALKYVSALKSDSVMPEEFHALMLKKFNEYLLVGGMPEAVARYAESRSFIDVDPVYESILTGFRDDVTKYASLAKAKYIQHIIEHASKYVGLQVKYEKFGESGFKSREMRDAFDVLEKAMLINRVFASASRQLPLTGNLKKSPKLLHLDVGLVNYQLGIRADLAASEDINAVYHGQISEQIAGQILLSGNVRKNAVLHYWYREQKGATSEIDYLIVINGKLVPVEVKSGKTGTLRSLLNFMDDSPCSDAVRVYSGNLKSENVMTPKKKKFRLHSIPFYLLHRIEELIS